MIPQSESTAHKLVDAYKRGVVIKSELFSGLLSLKNRSAEATERSLLLFGATILDEFELWMRTTRIMRSVCTNEGWSALVESGLFTSLLQRSNARSIARYSSTRVDVKSFAETFVGATDHFPRDLEIHPEAAPLLSSTKFLVGVGLGITIEQQILPRDGSVLGEFVRKLMGLIPISRVEQTLARDPIIAHSSGTFHSLHSVYKSSLLVGCAYARVARNTEDLMFVDRMIDETVSTLESDQAAL